ncbi:hypothetical protein quinque_011529 [Culex quinquefasciatus]
MFNRTKKYFTNCWRSHYSSFLHYTMILRRLLQTLTMEHSFDLLINGIHVAMGAALMLTRSLLIQANFGHFKQVRKYLNERSFRVDDPDVQIIRQQSYELSVKVTVFFIGNIIFQFISITSSGITDMDPFQLSFSMKEFIIIVIFRATLDTFTIMGVEFTLRYLIECYVFCHMVSSFNEEHSKIGPTLSHQPWITRLRCRKEFAGQYRQVRATILIVAMQSQRSLNISTGGLFELTLDKFTSLIKKSYTLMMVVWNMKQGEGVAW